jgi:hypothetical protein
MGAKNMARKLGGAVCLAVAAVSHGEDGGDSRDRVTVITSERLRGEITDSVSLRKPRPYIALEPRGGARCGEGARHWLTSGNDRQRCRRPPTVPAPSQLTSSDPELINSEAASGRNLDGQRWDRRRVARASKPDALSS